MEGVETFEEAGGGQCTVLPCLNDSDGGIALMNTIVTEELAGWRK
jgi:ferrochelatase